MVQIAVLVVLSLVTFTAGYIGYSRYLAQFVELDDERETPAHKYNDGQEYVPSKKPVLLGHHYSSIAGGAPIVGPITAGAAFGWLPAILWIAIGNPLFGAVHDFMSLSASVRHEGKSIGYIIGEYVGERGKQMLLWFAFLTIILVIAVFALVVAVVFDAFPSSATASMIYIALALAFGVYLYQFDLPFLPGAAAFVAMVFAGVWVGLQFPIAMVDTGNLPANTIVILGDAANWSWLPLTEAQNANRAAWVPVVVVYAFVASVLPVWVLLQPRDFLTSSLLYTGVGGMLLGVLVATGAGLLGMGSATAVYEGTTYSLNTQLPAFTGFVSALGPLFPFLFVTIACGTISGFHSLVSSGTTAKQLNKESDARAIGYGAMLGEGLLATVAIVTVAGLLFAPEGAASTASAGGRSMDSSQFGMAMVFVLLTYGGWNEAAYVSAELKDVQRNMIRALLISLGLITTLYLLVNWAYLNALGLEGMSGTDAVAADLMRVTFGETGAILLSVFVAIAALSSTNATIFTGARTNFALGRDASLFSALGVWNESGDTPANALWVQGGIALALVAVGAATRQGFESMVDYTAPVFWLFFLATGISLFVLRQTEPEVNRPFEVPLYPVIPIAFCLASVYMLWSSLAYTGVGALLGAGVLLVGVPLLWFRNGSSS